MSFDSSATGFALSFSFACCWTVTSPRCLMSRTKPYFSATFCATASSIVEFIDAKPPIWFSSEMSLKGFRLSATAKSRTMTGGLRWMILTPPSSVTTGADDEDGRKLRERPREVGARTGSGGGPAAGFGRLGDRGRRGTGAARTARAGPWPPARATEPGTCGAERGAIAGRGGGGDGALIERRGGRARDRGRLGHRLPLAGDVLGRLHEDADGAAGLGAARPAGAATAAGGRRRDARRAGAFAANSFSISST